MNTLRIVKEIKTVFECPITYQELNYKMEDIFYKVLEIDIEADSIKPEELVRLNKVLFDYDLKILEFGTNIYDCTLYIYIIEKR